MRDLLRSMVPPLLLNTYRNYKKDKRRKALERAKKDGKILTVADLVNDFTKLGIKKGDTLLVHAAMGNIGYLENGPKTVVDALLEVIGETGNLVMPTSPVAKLQYDYIRENNLFDVRNTPSAMGSISEYFRTMPGVIRSLHPTEPLSAYGPRAAWITSGHFGEPTPYTKNSPFYRVAKNDGKIMLLGVSVWVSTTLHVLEDIIPAFTFPIYHETVFQTNLIDYYGSPREMLTKVHNPTMSNRRKCGDLQAVFDQHGITKHGKVGAAAAQIIDAKGKIETMVKTYCETGVTMYTPEGIPHWKPQPIVSL